MCCEGCLLILAHKHSRWLFSASCFCVKKKWIYFSVCWVLQQATATEPNSSFFLVEFDLAHMHEAVGSCWRLYIPTEDKTKKKSADSTMLVRTARYQCLILELWHLCWSSKHCLKSCKLPVSPSSVKMAEKPANTTFSKHFVPPEESDGWYY